MTTHSHSSDIKKPNQTPWPESASKNLYNILKSRELHLKKEPEILGYRYFMKNGSSIHPADDVAPNWSTTQNL
jgi:hypothetical protein